jgi:hypothetical protein
MPTPHGAGVPSAGAVVEQALRDIAALVALGGSVRLTSMKPDLLIGF